MSSTNRGKIRQKDDFYKTPKWAVNALLSNVKISGKVLDPGCGDGAITGILLDQPEVTDVVGVEISRERAFRCKQGFPEARVLRADFFTSRLVESFSPYDAVVANPPFSLAEQFLARSRELVREGGGIHFLLRLGFLESKKRRYLFEKSTSGFEYLRVLPKRPKFIGNSTDSAAYGWFSWLTGNTPHLCARIDRLFIPGYDDT